MTPAAIESAKARLRFMLQGTTASEDDIADCMAVVCDCVEAERERCANWMRSETGLTNTAVRMLEDLSKDTP